MKIIPYSSHIGSHRTGSLCDLSVNDISKILGFTPNMPVSCDDKVVNQWNFTVNGSLCSIWDYKGSQKDHRFSTYGPGYALKSVFHDFYENN